MIAVRRASIIALVALFAVFALFVALLPFAVLAQGQRCFSETNQCMSGRIRQFWEENGGLPVFGFPITDQHQEILEGRPYQVQWFQRNRLELHPENQPPYDVLLGRLGADRLAQQGRNPLAFPKSGQQSGCRYFPQTQHNACDDFLAAWRASGLEIDGAPSKTEGENLALFGLPLSDVTTEQLEGRSYQVQWFERARFELHPENAPPYNVLFGLLGNEIRMSGGPPQPPKPTSVPGTQTAEPEPSVVPPPKPTTEPPTPTAEPEPTEPPTEVPTPAPAADG